MHSERARLWHVKIAKEKAVRGLLGMYCGRSRRGEAEPNMIRWVTPGPVALCTATDPSFPRFRRRSDTFLKACCI